MFYSKVPRLFILACFLLCVLVSYTTFYLYHHVPPAYPTASPHSPPDHDLNLDLDLGPPKVVQNIGGNVFEPVPIVTEARPIEPTAAATTTDSPAAAPSPPTAPVAGDDADEDLESGGLYGSERPNGHLTGIEGQSPHTPQPWTTPEEAEAQLQKPLLLPVPSECPKELQFMMQASVDQGLTESVRYTRRRIRPVFSSKVDRNAVPTIPETLLRGETEVDLWDCWDATVRELPPIKVEVPKPYAERSYEHFVFGIASDYNRLNDSIQPFSHWLSGSGAKLVGVVTDARDLMPGDIHRLEQAFHAADINATMVTPIDEKFTTSQNHFTVLIDMLEHSGPETQWFGLLDDDTFFPSLRPLSDSLATLDHNVDAYVGALSEDFQAVRLFGFMAFGGAGAYLSPSLAKKLGDNALKCIEEATHPEGDIIIRDCVYTNSKAKLTILPGLWQQDMKHDASGFFEAGYRPINLHHWKSWYHVPVEQMATAADFCGDCFLQRWRLGDDTLLANGFSITTYRDGLLDQLDLDLVEGTWERAGRDYDFSVGPLRPQLDPDDKHSYLLRAARLDEATGELRQVYVRENNPDMGELDEVVELIWERR
ncbi:glycosyltransferase family 31 protein [Xylariaceae sp. FL0804]|nr:glycosyltransferase family 31 protein [Xylariaceae sp. FL0804]